MDLIQEPPGAGVSARLTGPTGGWDETPRYSTCDQALIEHCHARWTGHCTERLMRIVLANSISA